MKIALLILLIHCSVYLKANAQNDLTTDKKSAIKSYNEALYYYTSNNYVKAIELFNKAITADKNFIEAYLVLAEAYEDNKQYDKAIDTYHAAFAINPGFYPYGHIRLANLEFKTARYSDAKKSYEEFLKLKSNNQKHIDKAKKGIERSEFAMYAVNNPVDFKPESLGPAVNTSEDEYWPSLSADENILIITRLVKSSSAYGGKQEDFFISEKDKNGWGIVKNAGLPLNTPDNEGAQTISGDGRLMVFTGCNRKDGVGRCDLYFSKKEGGKWTIPKNMETPVNSRYKETQPSLSADGRTLYFASDRPEGYGYLDIYVTTMNDDGTWRQPLNIGDKVNTRGHEMSPFIHPDNQTLYFSSDELIGLGGFDIFISRKDSTGQWGEPENIGYPINTNGDEYGLIVNAKGNLAYYASDKDPKMGRDIFVFELYKEARPVEVSYMKGTVFDSDTKAPIGAEFELIDLESEKMINNSRSDSINGEFLVCIPTNRNYLLNVSKRGYLFYSDNFALKGIFDKAEPFLKNVPLHPIKIGESIILRNIFFEFDSYKLKKESKVELDKLVLFLNQYPTIKIEISGHTDNIGTEQYNQTLSENRAKSVKEYLTGASISKDRITFTGYGFSKPITSNDTEAGRAQNRRTELKIIEK